jgi:hypothetical protein
MRKALWFSRHEPTPDQLKEISELGYELVEVEEGKALGAVAINSVVELRNLHDNLLRLAIRTGATAVFGVYPVPLQSMLFGRWGDGFSVIAYAAWNISRPVEGGKPTFEHFMFKIVGELPLFKEPLDA